MQKYLSKRGKKAGSVRSEAKASSSRANAAKARETLRLKREAAKTGQGAGA